MNKEDIIVMTPKQSHNEVYGVSKTLPQLKANEKRDVILITNEVVS